MIPIKSPDGAKLLDQIRLDIIDLQNSEKNYATLVQVPRRRVAAFNDMNDEELRETLQNFFTDEEGANAIKRIRANDLSWLTQISLRLDGLLNVRIQVAPDGGNDCNIITIIKGEKIYPIEADE